MSRQATQSAAYQEESKDASVIDFMSFAQKGWPNLRLIHEQFEKAGFPALGNFEEAKAMYKQTVGTLAKSAAVLADGAQEIGNHSLTLMRENLDSSIETAKAIADVQTPQDWFQLQSKWAQDFMTAVFDQIGKMSGLSMKVSSKVAEPIQAHINGTFDKIAKRG